MEMTSDEIIEAMRAEELTRQGPDGSDGDPATTPTWSKFAKATPDAEQNEADYLKSLLFRRGDQGRRGGGGDRRAGAGEKLKCVTDV